MYTELCVHLGAGRFAMIVSVHFHYNQGSKYGDKYDDKMMQSTIVLHESVEKHLGLSPHHISSGEIPLLQHPEYHNLYVLTNTMVWSGWMYRHRSVTIGS